MSALAKWTVRHMTAARIICIIIATIFSFLIAFYFEMGPVLTFVSILSLLIISLLWPTTAIAVLQKKPFEEFNNFNPTPLYELSEFILGCKIPAQIRTVWQINLAVALRDMGELERSYTMLKEIDAQDRKKVSPPTVLVLTNNLADLCVLTGSFEEADMMYASVQSIYPSLPKGFQKQLEPCYKSALVYEYMRTEKYRDIIVMLEGETPAAPRRRVSCAIDLSRAYIKLGEYDKAKAHLAYAISTARSTYDSRVAQNILASITE